MENSVTQLSELRMEMMSKKITNTKEYIKSRNTVIVLRLWFMMRAGHARNFGKLSIIYIVLQ